MDIRMSGPWRTNVRSLADDIFIFLTVDAIFPCADSTAARKDWRLPVTVSGQYGTWEKQPPQTVFMVSGRGLGRLHTLGHWVPSQFWQFAGRHRTKWTGMEDCEWLEILLILISFTYAMCDHKKKEYYWRNTVIPHIVYILHILQQSYTNTRRQECSKINWSTHLQDLPWTFTCRNYFPSICSDTLYHNHSITSCIHW